MGPAVALLEAWLDLVPPFVQDNIQDQLVLPKVQRAMSDWKPRRASASSGSLHGIVFAWLPFVGLRAEELLGDAKRRVKSLFRSVEISRVCRPSSCSGNPCVPAKKPTAHAHA